MALEDSKMNSKCEMIKEEDKKSKGRKLAFTKLQFISLVLCQACNKR